jgi:alanine dehydrogenase
VDAGTLILTRSDVAALLDTDDCIAAVEQGFRLHALGQTPAPAVLGVHVTGGGFHVKAAGLTLGRSYFAAKCNGNFPDNRARFGLPTIQGVVILCDAERGTPLAVMDSGEITALRTAAATAVAAKYCARSDASSVTICGCGLQGRYQLRAITRVRKVKRVWAVDVDPAVAQRFAAELGAELGVPVTVERSLAAAARQSDMVITCTTSRKPILDAGDVAAGAFVAGVGADNPEKQELAPELMAAHTVVTDLTEQCAAIGDLHHAIAAGRMAAGDVYAELGQIVVGRLPGRRGADEVVIFDSTGTALQDVAAAAVVYERAVAAGRGTKARLAD